jgi:hypothetical protein
VFLPKYYYGIYIKDDEMGVEAKFSESFDGKHERKKPSVRPGRKCGYNIKVYFKN